MKTHSALLLSACLLASSHCVLSADDAHHFPGVFIGYTNADSKTEFTYGIEYEYKLNKYWGGGFVYEEVVDAHHGDGVSVKVAQLFYHPLKNVRLGLGGGKEKIGGNHPHSEDLYRLSASYEYHIGNFGIAPTFAADFIDGEKAYVFGVSFIRIF
jgi:hypothetical protein